jgi:hypothetical protein
MILGFEDYYSVNIFRIVTHVFFLEPALDMAHISIKLRIKVPHIVGKLVMVLQFKDWKKL